MRIKQHSTLSLKKDFKLRGSRSSRKSRRFFTLQIVLCGAFALALSYYYADEIKHIVFPMKTVPEDFLLKCDKYNNFSSSFVEPPLTEFGRYLLVESTGELFTKSRIHLAEFILIARRTKRVLVLPHVASGYVGSGKFYPLPLCLYFDLKKLGKKVPWVSENYFFQKMKDFQKVKGSYPAASRLVIYLPGSECRAMTSSKFNSSSHWSTLDPFLVNNWTTSIPQICTVHCGPRFRGNIYNNYDTASLATIIENDNVLKSSDVVIAAQNNWQRCSEDPELAKKFFPSISPRITQFVEAFIRAKLDGGNFIAVQWRMERSIKSGLKIPNFKSCSLGLIESLKELKQKFKISKLFWSSEFSLDGRLFINSLAREEVSEQFSLVQEIHKTLGFVHYQEFYPKIEEVDDGVMSALDQLVCIKAKYFVHSPDPCLGKGPFTEAILTKRKQSKRAPQTSFQWKVTEDSENWEEYKEVKKGG